MLADISSVDAIYIVCGRTDMRKSIDGLCAIIQEQFSMEIDHALFLFCGRKCDRIHFFSHTHIIPPDTEPEHKQRDRKCPVFKAFQSLNVPNLLISNQH